MHKFLPVLVLLLAVSDLHAQDTGQAGADEVRILALENAWNRAVQQKDEAALKLLLGPDLVYVDYDGTMMNKAAYLASVRSQSLHASRIVSESMKVGESLRCRRYCERRLSRNWPEKRQTLLPSRAFYRHLGPSTPTWVCVASQSTSLLQ